VSRARRLWGGVGVKVPQEEVGILHVFVNRRKTIFPVSAELPGRASGRLGRARQLRGGHLWLDGVLPEGSSNSTGRVRWGYKRRNRVCELATTRDAHQLSLDRPPLPSTFLSQLALWWHMRSTHTMPTVRRTLIARAAGPREPSFTLPSLSTIFVLRLPCPSHVATKKKCIRVLGVLPAAAAAARVGLPRLLGSLYHHQTPLASTCLASTHHLPNPPTPEHPHHPHIPLHPITTHTVPRTPPPSHPPPLSPHHTVPLSAVDHEALIQVREAIDVDEATGRGLHSFTFSSTQAVFVPHVT